MKINNQVNKTPLATEIIFEMKKTLQATRTCLEFVRDQSDKSIREINNLLEEREQNILLKEFYYAVTVTTNNRS